MEEVFINALATRCQIEGILIDLLPNDIKLMVEDKLSELNEAMLRTPEDKIEQLEDALESTSVEGDELLN